MRLMPRPGLATCHESGTTIGAPPVVSANIVCRFLGVEQAMAFADGAMRLKH
jgi:hypothetical protein